MGSLLYPDGSCRFRVWAPFAKQVQVIGDFTNWQANSIDLTAEGNGNWSADVPGVQALQRYKYVIENVGGAGNDNSHHWERPDARALQVEHSGPAAASYVIPPFDQSQRPSFTTPAFENFLLYQLHVGSFAGLNDLRAAPVRNRTATFLDTVEKLSYIRDLGFNGIALLPVGEISGDIGLGYGTCDMFAPEDAYASSKEKAVKELLAIVDEAHRRGLTVIFDVDYNHGAVNDNRYWRYDGNCYGICSEGGGEYFESGHDTQFGCGFALWRQKVKDFFLDNARMFLRDYRGDGLRFDAVQFLQPDALQYITGPLRREFPDKYLIAEYNAGDPQRAFDDRDPFKDLGFDATWDLSAPSLAYEALSGTDPVNNLLRLIGDFSTPSPWRSVRYLLGSHDQIYDSTGGQLDKRYLVARFGGRDNGWAQAKARLAWALNAALPGTPMLFMGTEGHLDGYWAPEDTHGEHRLDWSKVGDPIGARMQHLVRDANNLRWQHPALRSPTGNVVHVDHTGQVVAVKRYTFDRDLILVVVNVSDSQWTGHVYGVTMRGESGTWGEIFNSLAPIYGGINTTGNFGEQLHVSDNQLFINLPSWSVVMFQEL